MIKKLKPCHVNRSFEIITSAIKDLKAKKIDQWDDLYPTFEDIRNDIETAQAFGFFLEDYLAGYIALNQENPDEYSEVVFTYDDETALTVHRLTVDPLYQNRGIAGSMMIFAEDYARKNRYISIRLDAYSKNLKALEFYSRLMYTDIGKVQFRKGVFHIFEKNVLDTKY